MRSARHQPRASRSNRFERLGEAWRLHSRRAPTIGARQLTMKNILGLALLVGVLAAPTLASAKDLVNDINRQEVALDKKEIRADKKEIRTDKKEIKQDKKEIRADKKEIRADKKEARQDRKELKQDRKELRQDRKELKQDR